MTAEQALILTVLRNDLNGAETASSQLPPDLDWTTVPNELYVHSITLPFYSNIFHLQDQIPAAPQQKLSKFARRATARNLRSEYLQNLLTAYLDQENIPYVILKGEAAAAYYPTPETRQLGDVDFMIPPQNADRIIQAFQQQGFEHSCEEAPYHQILKKGSNWMELHFEPAGIPEGKPGQLVREFLSGIFEERQKISGSSASFYAPCSAHHGLILLLHMQHHMTELGMGLRHLIDWACFVQKTYSHPFWEESLLPLLRQIGLFHYAAVVTKLCALQLHTPCPPWARYPEDALCYAVLEDILACGSFGQKDKTRSRSNNMLRDRTKEQPSGGKLSLLYHTLQNSVVNDQPQLARRPVLRFFAMAWKACRYLLLCCFGKRPNLLRAARYADSREAVYRQLRIFEPE